jgi:hypothetical protein
MIRSHHGGGRENEGTREKDHVPGCSDSLMVVAPMATAMAGEVTGNGKSTPIQSYQAGSICSFSGQNDDPNEEGDFADGRVQSFGDIVQEVVGIIGYRGVSTMTDTIKAEGPGTSCRGYASGG